MEIRGEDFIKKVQLKQEKNEIEQRLSEINTNESQFEEAMRNPSSNTSQLDREIEIQEEREYSDIMLGKNSSNEQNKKKYLILGLILVILFLLTIIVIRLLTNDSSEDSFTQNNDAQTQNVLGNENIEEQYQKIINEKLKNIKEEKVKEAQQEEKLDEQLDLQKIEQKEVVQEEQQEEAKPDVFDVKKDEPQVQPTKVISKPKPVAKPVQTYTLPKQSSSSTSVTSAITTKPKGTFVQIGAFSKMPSVKYLNNIREKGFSYKIYKVSINNKMFHKLLIGPYGSRSQAKIATDQIKKQLKVSGAFILTY